MTRFSTALVAAVLAISGCAQHGTSNDSARAGVGVRAADGNSKAGAADPSPLPKIELTEQLMFKLMLAEVALQRGQTELAVPAYVELARETRDPRIAQRATEAAWNARLTEPAL